MATGTLTGQTIANTYKALLKITGTTAGGETLHATTQKVIEDGDGNPFPFSAAQDAILMTGTSRLEFNDNGEYISGDGTNLTITSGADIVFALGATGSVYHTGDGGTSNTIYGKDAGIALASGGDYNVFLGENAGEGITVSDDNVAIGYNAFFRATTQSDKNVAIGSSAMSGNFTTADVDSCVIIGYDAGSGALTSGATGTVAIGHQAGKSITSGAANVVIGYQAATALTTGQENVVVGHQAMDAADGTEEGNTALGHGAMGAMDEQGNAVNFNIAIGKNALLGGAAGGDVLQNVAIGYNCMDATAANAPTGTVGIGGSALTALTSGAGNTAVGYQAADANTVGEYNTVLGYQAFTTNVDGDKNTAIGYQALYTMEVPDGDGGDTAVGYQSLQALTTGENNVAVGSASGTTIQTGVNNTCIGQAANTSAEDADNQTVIGKATTGVADNSVTLGNASVTAVYMAQDSMAHVHCGEVTIKSTATSSSAAGGIIELSGDDGTVMASGEQLGRIKFAGSESSAAAAGSNTIDQGAAIFAKAYGNWDANSNGSTLFFATCPEDNSDTSPIQRMTIHSGGMVLIGDTENGNMTQGLTINQAANDDEILAFKSSDIAHGMTGQGETDTWGKFYKAHATGGGLAIKGMTDTDGGAGNAMYLSGILGEAADTDKSVGASAIVIISSTIKDGTGHQSAGANQNLVAIVTGGDSRFIFDAEGSFHADVESTTFDTYEDAQLVRAFDLSHNKDVIASKFDEFIDYNHETLADLKLVGREKDGTPNKFLNVTKLQQLHNGAIWQQYTEMQNMKELMYDTMVEMLGKEKADAKLKDHDIKLLDNKTLLN